MLHRRVVRGREEEAEAELVDRARDPLGRKLELEAERLEHVRRPGGGRDGAVPVLRDRGAGGGGDQGGGGRDVERARAVAARTGRVHEVVARRPHGERVLPHRLGAAGDLLHGLALRAQGDEEAGDLHGRGLAGHDLVHHAAGLGTREVVSVEES